MPKSTGEKQRDFRLRQSFNGLFKIMQVWVHPLDRHKIKKLEDELRQERINNLTGDKKMTLNEIKKAVDEGKIVRWINNGFQVMPCNILNYKVVRLNDGHELGLTCVYDDVTANGRDDYFYIEWNINSDK